MHGERPGCSRKTLGYSSGADRGTFFMETTALPDLLPVLAGLLDRRLVVIDVGARWGVAPIWDQLGDQCHTIGFEPDEAECSRLAHLNRSHDRRRFVPVGLGATTGMATLYLTRDHKGSSLYPPSNLAVSRHPGLADGHLEATEIIEVMALDDWCAQEGIAQIDAMKIDTQGSELDVLKGAAGMLQGVRLLEVEVEFNPLYEGIPLFWAVDQFLRSQGFVLWCFRDLAHYAQAGAPTDWRIESHVYYDEVIAKVPAAAGQLFWANAYYVKADVAYPEAGAGWRQLVRDACITAAHKLYDLAGLAVELAKHSAPPEVAAELEVASSAQLQVARRERALVDRSTVLEGSVKVGVADPAFMGGGWHPAQVLDHGGVRWSGPGRDAWVDVPHTLVPGTRLEVLVVGFLGPGMAESFSCEVNRVPVALSASPHVRGSLYAGVIPDGYAPARAATRVMFHTATPVAWNVVNPESDDDTELGVAISWLRLTAPGGREPADVP